MSPWRHRPISGPIPIVPDDREERRRAIEQSAKGLAEALSQVPLVTERAAALNTHDAQNHYAIRIRETYGGNRFA